MQALHGALAGLPGILHLAWFYNLKRGSELRNAREAICCKKQPFGGVTPFRFYPIVKELRPDAPQHCTTYSAVDKHVNMKNGTKYI